MTIIQFNPNNIEAFEQPKRKNQEYFSLDYPDDSFEFVDYDLDEVEQPKRTKEPKNLEIENSKERKKLLSEAWGIYYRSIDELNKMNPKSYYAKSYSCKKDNHFEITKFSGKSLFGNYSTKEVFVFKNNAPITYSKYKLKYAYDGRDKEGWNFSLKETLLATCNFLN